MLKPGSVVTAVLGTNEEGKQRVSFGKLAANEIYRVSGIVNGNDGQPVKVRLAGEQSYWPASLFVEMSEEEVELIREKMAEAQSVGAVMSPKLTRALETA